MKLLPLAAAAVASLLFVAGCSTKTTLTLGLPAINGVVVYLKASGAQPARTEADVTVDGTRLVPVVAINSDTVDLINYSGEGEYMWSSTWRSDNLNVLPGKECQLKVFQSDGEASSPKLMLPAGFSITAPAESSRLARGSPLTITWPAVTGIDRYEVTVTIDYSYYDTSHYFQHFALDTSFAVSKDTLAVTFAAGTVFPPDVDSVRSGYGSISVTAEAGPNIGHESKGNISGNGIGYFWTRTSDDVLILFGIADVRNARGRSERQSARQVLAEKQRRLREVGKPTRVS
jgi:hypothetical protein